MGSMVQLQRKKEKGNKTRSAQATDREKRRRSICTVWRTLYAGDAGTIAIISRILESHDGGGDCVGGVQACGLGGQNGDNVPVNEIWGVRCRSQSLQPARHINKRSRLRAWAGLSAQT